MYMGVIHLFNNLKMVCCGSIPLITYPGPIGHLGLIASLESGYPRVTLRNLSFFGSAVEVLDLFVQPFRWRKDSYIQTDRINTNR